MYEPADLWRFLPHGYMLTVLIETTVLLVGLSDRHRLRVRLFSGFGLTAITYPIVILVMPLLLMQYGRGTYLAVAETFAPAAECIMFLLVFGDRRRLWDNVRDCAAITLANLASFLLGLWIY